jgi:hypothetical protein
MAMTGRPPESGTACLSNLPDCGHFPVLRSVRAFCPRICLLVLVYQSINQSTRRLQAADGACGLCFFRKLAVLISMRRSASTRIWIGLQVIALFQVSLYTEIAAVHDGSFDKFTIATTKRHFPACSIQG